MTRPPDPSQQPWWSRPGGAPPPPGALPYPRQHPPQQGPPPGRPPHPPAPQPYPPQPPRGSAPTDPIRRPPVQPPPPPAYSQRRSPVIDPSRYTLPPGTPTPHRAPTKGFRPDSRTLIIGGCVAVALLLVGVGLWQFLFRDTTVINVEQAEAGVREILSDPINGYGANSISALRCNDGKDPSATKGASFTCAVEIDGAIRHVYVEFQDDKGTFAVDGPR